MDMFVGKVCKDVNFRESWYWWANYNMELAWGQPGNWG